MPIIMVHAVGKRKSHRKLVTAGSRLRIARIWRPYRQCIVTLGKSDPRWVAPAGCDQEVKAMLPQPKSPFVQASHVPTNSKTTPNSVRKVAHVVFYAVMLCLLIPIGTFAIFGTQNERPRRLFYWCALKSQQPCLLAFENGPSRAKIYCIDLKKRSMTTCLTGSVSNLKSVSHFNTQVWT